MEPADEIRDKERAEGASAAPGDTDSPPPQRWRLVTPTGAAVIGLLLLPLLQWLLYAPGNGMPYETTLILGSKTDGLIRGFIYWSDPLRPFTIFWYHIGELLSRLPGLIGSYLGIQVVLLTIWVARNLLFFALLRKVIKLPLSVSFAAAAILSIHASDGALHWVGQLNQYGMMFFGIASLFFFGRAARASGLLRAHSLALASLFCYMSLWSYESQVFVLVAGAIAIALIVPGSWKQRAGLVPYFLIPVTYGALTLYRYQTNSGTYQSGVTRTDLTLKNGVGDTLWNSGESLAFWNWGFYRPFPHDALAYAVVVVSVIIAGWLTAYFAYRDRPREERAGETGDLDARSKAGLRVLQVGLVLLPLSFPAYVLLTSARGLWRTQFLSGFAAALVLAGLAFVLSASLPRLMRTVLPAVLVGAIVFWGASAGVSAAAFHDAIWERFRERMWAIEKVVPDVKNGTVIVVLDAETRDHHDPFGHSMWFDVGLQLAYPGHQVAGLYYLDNGSTPGPGPALTPSGDTWGAVPGAFPAGVSGVPLANTIFVRLHGTRATIMSKIPSVAQRWWPQEVRYDPQSRLGSRRVPPPEAEGRYGPK